MKIIWTCCSGSNLDVAQEGLHANLGNMPHEVVRNIKVHELAEDAVIEHTFLTIVTRGLVKALKMDLGVRRQAAQKPAVQVSNQKMRQHRGHAKARVKPVAMVLQSGAVP
mmetsp:Transcript_109809/g.309619  ORF Transcript_109809/g.309619 Transcript_109809/m.309619 type:complete len:110 (-) Transcript_109809:7-336(-)